MGAWEGLREGFSMRIGKRNSIRLGFVLLLGLALAGGAFCRTDPRTGKIRLLHIGLAFLRPDHPDPVFLMDPKIDLTMVPAFSTVMETAEIRRMMRLYMPRTKEEVSEGLDLILIDGVDAYNVNREFLRWTTDLVLTTNLSFVMSDSGSGWSFAGSGTDWYGTAIEPILSVDDQPGREASVPGFLFNSFKIVPVDPSHELMRNIPWDEVGFVAMNRPTERLGAKVIARMSGEKALNRGKPVIAYIDFPGGGRSASYIFTWHTMVDTPLVLEFYRWRWHYDVLVHMIYWPCQEPIPEDLFMVHSVRQLFTDVYLSRIFVTSTLDFAEKAGANLREIELELVGLDGARMRIDDLYIDNEMADCYELCLDLMEDYGAIVDAALKAKDRALFWIFLAEWAIVTSTSMVVGLLVWTLMVKRRLYREVGRTRLLLD
jgi:hypothetical protein